MNNINSTTLERVPMSSRRKTSLLAGVIYLITFVSIPTLALYSQVKSANYITGSGPDTPVIIGGILEIIVALAGIGTTVVLYPVLRKQNESAALGLVAARILESGTIFVEFSLGIYLVVKGFKPSPIMQADARVVMVFAVSPRQFYLDKTNPAHLPRPYHLDSFIVTPNLHPSIRTLQKLMPTLTLTT